MSEISTLLEATQAYLRPKAKYLIAALHKFLNCNFLFKIYLNAKLLIEFLYSHFDNTSFIGRNTIYIFELTVANATLLHT